MLNIKSTLTIICILITLVGCDFQKEVDVKFGDQHFKTVISLVELHKIRTGSYPETLKDIKFTGDWDAIALSSVKYKKMESGYELEVTNGWISKPDLMYPKEFWQGLGLLNPNIKDTK